jgi:hypothetical protein
MAENKNPSVVGSTAKSVTGFFKGAVGGAITGGIITAMLGTVAALAGWAIGGSESVVGVMSKVDAFIPGFNVGGIGTAIGGAAALGGLAGAAAFGTLGAGVGTVTAWANTRPAPDTEISAVEKQQILATGVMHGAALTGIDNLQRQAASMQEEVQSMKWRATVGKKELPVLFSEREAQRSAAAAVGGAAASITTP